METNPTQVPSPTPTMTQEQMLAEIYENTRKTKNYMKWQLYITIILIVLPLLAAIAIVPFVMKSLGDVYGTTQLLQ